MPYQVAIALQGMKYVRLKVTGAPMDMAANPGNCAHVEPASSGPAGLCAETVLDKGNDVAVLPTAVTGWTPPVIWKNHPVLPFAAEAGNGQKNGAQWHLPCIAGCAVHAPWSPRVAPELMATAPEAQHQEAAMVPKGSEGLASYIKEANLSCGSGGGGQSPLPQPWNNRGANYDKGRAAHPSRAKAENPFITAMHPGVIALLAGPCAPTSQ